MDRDMVNCLHYLYQRGQLSAGGVEPDRSRETTLLVRPRHAAPARGPEDRCRGSANRRLKLSPESYDLIDMLESQLRSMPKPDLAFGFPISTAIRAEGKTRPAFLAISYAPQFDLVKLAVKEAATLAHFECEVTGDLDTAGNIMDQVWQGIRGADAVVADITGKNPNVFYEIGLAHALGKEVILISQEPEAPFDVRSSRRVTYSAHDLDGLKTKLTDAFARHLAPLSA